MRRLNIIAALIINFTVAIIAHAEGMCKSGELTIFNCELSKSISSLCQSANSEILTYRSGIDGRVNLEISDHNNNNVAVFYFSNTPYAGGGESRIRFANREYTYYLYDKTVKTDGGPTFSAGIVIYKRRNRIFNLVCNNDASIREGAYQSIGRENYHSIGEK
ncbi:MAG TPA: hypothetical protein VF534_22555 [Paraburkholderia sp.]